MYIQFMCIQYGFLVLDLSGEFVVLQIFIMLLFVYLGEIFSLYFVFGMFCFLVDWVGCFFFSFVYYVLEDFFVFVWICVLLYSEERMFEKIIYGFERMVFEFGKDQEELDYIELGGVVEEEECIVVYDMYYVWYSCGDVIGEQLFEVEVKSYVNGVNLGGKYFCGNNIGCDIEFKVLFKCIQIDED